MQKGSFKGFIPLTKEEKILISGSGLGAVTGIMSAVSSGISIIEDTTDLVFNSMIKSKIISKIDETEKGELELNKNGVKIKWDNTSKNDPINSLIIF